MVSTTEIVNMLVVIHVSVSHCSPIFASSVWSVACDESEGSTIANAAVAALP